MMKLVIDDALLAFANMPTYHKVITIIVVMEPYNSDFNSYPSLNSSCLGTTTIGIAIGHCLSPRSAFNYNTDRLVNLWWDSID